MDRTACLEEILAIEWEMMGQVQSLDGPTTCQHDAKTFRIMRQSQWSTWDTPLLESYLADLKDAITEGRNLLAEKYARMTIATDPEEAEHLEQYLPPVSLAKEEMIGKILAIHQEWLNEITPKYPLLLRLMRPQSEAQTPATQATVATYLTGELATYSERTLRLYLAACEAKKERGENEVHDNLCAQTKAYGFSSPEACEEALAKRQA